MFLEQHHGAIGIEYMKIGEGVHGIFEVRKVGDTIVGRKRFHPSISIEKILQERETTKGSYILILEAQKRGILPLWIVPISLFGNDVHGTNALGKEVFDGISVRQIWDNMTSIPSLFDDYEAFLVSGMTLDEFTEMYNISADKLAIYTWYVEFEKLLISYLEKIGIRSFDLAPKNILLDYHTAHDFGSAILNNQPFTICDHHKICPNCDTHDWLIDVAKAGVLFGDIATLQAQRIDQETK